MSSWASGSASGPSPRPPGPWHFWHLSLKIALPLARTVASTVNGFFVVSASGGMVHPDPEPCADWRLNEAAEGWRAATAAPERTSARPKIATERGNIDTPLFASVRALRSSGPVGIREDDTVFR